MDFRRPDRDPDLEVEISLLHTEQGGPKLPLLSGIRVPHDFGLSDELNDGMYEFPRGGVLHPGMTGRAFVWLLAPERNTGRFSPGFEFKIWNGGWVGKGRILRVLNDQLKGNAKQSVPPHSAEPQPVSVVRPDENMIEPIELIYSEDRKRRVVIFRHSSNSYTYKEERHFKNEAAEGWAPLYTSPSFYDSLETARREIRHNVPWLAESD